jgi:hypothetical protein
MPALAYALLAGIVFRATTLSLILIIGIPILIVVGIGWYISRM